jgi:flavin reductase (DIM6/NTAB) family NADH-FMN oxidoreductase RutF
MTVSIDPKTLEPEESYKLVIGTVVPRPIAWVTSRNAQGGVNLAPFSAFMFVSPKPPLLAISVGHKAGVYKDTVTNILQREDYVIHIANMAMIEPLHMSSIEHPPDVSEVDLLGLATERSTLIETPRLRDAPIALECRFRQCLEFGHTKSRLIVGEVVMFHVRDDLIKDGKIDTKALDPICRLGGPRYAGLGEIVTMQPVEQTKKS